MTGIRAFYNAFKDPESEIRNMTNEQRVDAYAISWMYYRSMMFARPYDWSVYLAARDLYKHTRLIYNPVPQIVDFYVDNLWQPASNETVPSLITPVADSTDENVLEAVAQLDQWGNFLAESQKIKRYAAATGNVLVEGVDDLIRQKVLHKAVWPGHVTAIELNDTGDVLGYTVEYPVYDNERKDTFQYKKVVSRETFSYFRDGKPFTPPGKTAEVEANPYGFCFAVWLRHTDDGADYGLPACKDIGKIENLNGLASHIDDYMHKAIESPKIIMGGGTILPIVGAATNKANRTLIPEDPRLNWVVFQASETGSVHDLSGILKLADASPELERQLQSFHDDYPELQANAIIRNNSQLSGAALERMLGPAQNRLDGVQAGYNQQLVKLRQMQMSVAGLRTRQGWSSLTDQQRKFSDFNLQSYERGEMDFMLDKAVLVRTTESENEDLLLKKAQRATELEPMVGSKESLRVAGYSDDRIEEILREMDNESNPPSDPAVLTAARFPNSQNPNQLMLAAGSTDAGGVQLNGQDQPRV